jgi:hypothetical protein
MTDETKAYEQLNWTEIQGNAYIYQLSLLMLTPEGEKKVISCYLKGQSVKHDMPIKREVLFDIAFVKAKIQKLILEPFQQESLSEVEGLVNLAEKNHERSVTDEAN